MFRSILSLLALLALLALSGCDYCTQLCENEATCSELEGDEYDDAVDECNEDWDQFRGGPLWGATNDACRLGVQLQGVDGC